MSRKNVTVICAPVFQRLLLAVAQVASPAFRQDPIVAVLLHPAWKVVASFPTQDVDALATTFAALIQEYANPQLTTYISTLATLGHVASTILWPITENPYIVEVQELDNICQALHDESSLFSTWSCSFIEGPTKECQYVQFVAI